MQRDDRSLVRGELKHPSGGGHRASFDTDSWRQLGGPASAVAAVSWSLYPPYELWIQSTCVGDCNIRIDLGKQLNAASSVPGVALGFQAMTKNPTPMKDAATEYGRPITGWRLRLYTIVFEANMRAGRAFDLTLIACILASVAVVVLDSMSAVHDQHAALLGALEWTFTLLFTAEYVARLLCVRHPGRYARSVFGIIDPLAVLPAYLAVLVPGLHALIDVRVLRLLRLFRIFKLGAYVAEFGALGQALAASRPR